MGSVISPEAAVVMAVIAEETTLVEGWEVSGLWLDGVQNIAQFVADMRGTIGLDDAMMLVGIGAMMLEMAKRERCAAEGSGLFEND